MKPAYSPQHRWGGGCHVVEESLEGLPNSCLKLCPNLCSAEGGPELSWLFVLEKAATFLCIRKWKIIFSPEKMLAENRMESGGPRREIHD